MAKKLLFLLAALCVVGAGYVQGQELVGDVVGNGAGSHLATPEGYEISGKGQDIWGGNDAFYFLHTVDPVPGDFEVTCRIESFRSDCDVNTWAKGGFMARTSTAADAANAFAALTFHGLRANWDDRRYTLQHRDSDGAGSGSSHNPGFTTPIEIRLVRVGNTFSSYYRYDAADPWTQWRSYTFPATEENENELTDAGGLLVGFAVTNHIGDLSKDAANALVTDPQLRLLPDVGIADLAGEKVDEEHNLTWTAEGEIDHYAIERVDDTGLTLVTDTLGGAETSFTDAGPVEGTPTYIVTPYTADGPGLEQSVTVAPPPVVYGGITPAGEITKWVISPHYTQEGGWKPGIDNMLKDYLTDDADIDESNFLPEPESTVATNYDAAASTGCTVGDNNIGSSCDPPTWKEVENAGDGFFDFAWYYGDQNDVMTYAVTYITNNRGEDTMTYIKVNSDDSCVVMVDNSVWHTYEGCCYSEGWMEIPDGEHRLMVKVFEGGGGHNFRLTMVDPDTGEAFPPGDFEVSTTPTMTEVPAAGEVVKPEAPAGMDGSGFINDWLILGHYNQDTGAGGGSNPPVSLMRQDCLTEGEGGLNEQNILPVEGMEVNTDYDAAASTGCNAGDKDEPVTTCDPLTVLAVEDVSQCVNFENYFGGQDNVMTYMFCYLTNKTDDKLVTRMGAGSDDSIQVLIDNVEWHIHSVPRGCGTNQDLTKVPITPGTHRIMVKVFEGAGGHQGSLGFVDFNSLMPYTADKMEVSLTPPEGFEVPAPPEVMATRTMPCHVPEGSAVPVTVELEVSDVEVDVMEQVDPALDPKNFTPDATYENGVITWTGVSGSVSYEITALPDAPAIEGLTVDPAAGLVKIGGKTGVAVSEVDNGWFAADIGGPGKAGSQLVADLGETTFMEVAGGGGDIWGTSDQFRYVWKEFDAENFYLEGHILNFPAPGYRHTNDWAKAGLMLRNTCTANSAFVGAAWRTGNAYCGGTPGFDFQGRSEDGAGAWHAGLTDSHFGTKARLVKLGNQVTCFYSPDGGETWENRGTGDFPDEGNFLAGVAVTAHNNGEINAADLYGIDYGTLPPCVVDFSATPADGNVQLTWSIDGGGNYSPYRLERRGILQSEWTTVVDNISYTATSFTDSPPAEQGVFVYRLNVYDRDKGILICQPTTTVVNEGYAVYQEGVFPTPEYEGGADAHIITYQKDNNTGANATIEEGDWGGGHTDHKEGLVKFALEGLPEGKVVESATLGLYYDYQRRGGLDPVDHTVYVQQVLKQWNEGSGGGNDGQSASDGDVTWNSARHNEEAWEVGGAYGMSDIAMPTEEVSAVTGANPGQWVEFGGNGLRDIVNSWVLGASGNNGFKITQNPGHNPEFDYVAGGYNYASAQFGDASRRPVLILKLTEDSAPTVEVSADPVEADLCEDQVVFNPEAVVGDPDGDDLTVQWSAAPSEGVSISDAAALNPEVAINTVGTYELTCTVSDGILVASASVTLTVNECPAEYLFVGDANLDGAVDISDATTLLGYVFQGQGVLCAAQLDTNNDDGIDVSDAIKLLGYIFTGDSLTAPDGTEIPSGEAGCFGYPPDQIGDLGCEQRCNE